MGTEPLMTIESSQRDHELPEPDWLPQFSLRSILVLSIAFAVWLSLWGKGGRLESAGVAEYEQRIVGRK
jgi:hypothetical protein